MPACLVVDSNAGLIVGLLGGCVGGLVGRVGLRRGLLSDFQNVPICVLFTDRKQALHLRLST